MKASQLEVKQAMSRSIGYVGICALVLVGSFVVTMDVLKYVLRIAPVHEDREGVREKRAKNHTMIRFIYVDS